MKTLLPTIILTLTSCILLAQAGNGNPGSDILAGVINYADLSVMNKAIKHSGTRAENSYTDTAGSAFLSEETIEGTVFMNDGTAIQKVPLLIDLYSQEIIATDHTGKDIILDETFYSEITFPFEGQTLRYKKVNPEKPYKFFEVLYQDEQLTFFKERYVTIREGANLGLASRKPKFIQRTNHYILQSQDQVTKVKLKKKDVFSLFPKRIANSMQSYAKQHNLKLKNEEDFIKVFRSISEK